jgi:hypothetical protein
VEEVQSLLIKMMAAQMRPSFRSLYYFQFDFLPKYFYKDPISFDIYFRSTPAAAKQKHFYFIVRNERINISGAFLSACGVSVSVKSRVLSGLYLETKPL